MPPIPRGYALRAFANGAARGDMEKAVDLIRVGNFLTAADALRFIGANQTITREIFELVSVAWEFVDAEDEIRSLPQSVDGPPL